MRSQVQVRIQRLIVSVESNQENAAYSQEYIIEEVSIRDQRPILKTSLEVKDG